jgi:oxalate---CoA ligase
VDDAFHVFAWSIIVQQPTVCVGTIPPGVTTEVYVAPQPSANRKGKAKGEEHVTDEAYALQIIPDAKHRPLHSLKADYGDALRIAVDPETSFAAITGSHIRVRRDIRCKDSSQSSPISSRQN